MIRWRAVAALILAGWTGAAQAQAYRCDVGSDIAAPRAQVAGQRRVARVAGYTLALTWSPGYCRRSRGDPRDAVQCGSGNRFGFTLHGLWPEGRDSRWPQYCRAAGPIPPAVVRRNLCMMPSVQLMQHEYARHGTCMSATADGYFAQSRQLYARLRYPDMAALSRRARLTAGQVAAAVAAANPGLSRTMLRVRARDGWLDEVRVCLDRRFQYRACPAHQRGAADGAPIRIWR